MYTPIHCTQQRMRELAAERQPTPADAYPDWTAATDRDLLERTCPAELAHWRAIRAKRKALGNDIEARLRLWPDLARAYSAIAQAFQYRPAKNTLE